MSVELLRACDLDMFIPLEYRAEFPGSPDAFAVRFVKCWTYRWCWIDFCTFSLEWKWRLERSSLGLLGSRVAQQSQLHVPKCRRSGKGMSSLLTICIELILIFYI